MTIKTMKKCSGGCGNYITVDATSKKASGMYKAIDTMVFKGRCNGNREIFSYKAIAELVISVRDEKLLQNLIDYIEEHKKFITGNEV